MPNNMENIINNLDSINTLHGIIIHSTVEEGSILGHSKIEKDVLDFLLKGTQPIIMVLARNMKTRFPAEQRKAIEENRLLIISPFDDKVTQNTKESCYKRNKVILEIADEVFVAFATKNGKLEKLLANVRSNKSCKVWK